MSAPRAPWSAALALSGACVATVLSGCPDEPARAIVGTDPRRIDDHRELEAVPPVEPPREYFAAAPPDPTLPTNDPRAPETVTETITETVEVPAPAARDLGEELRVALGAPDGCLDLETVAAAHGSMRIGVSTSVLPSGRILRATVTGLPAEAARCLESRALGVSLATPIDGAPRNVSTTLVFGSSVTRTPPPPAPPPPPFRLQPGQEGPAETLPAIGATGRPSGFVAPSETLPAATDQGRPPGFVPPSSTLPALAP